MGSEELWYNSRYELSAFMVAYIFETLLHIVFLGYICSQSLVNSDKQRTKKSNIVRSAARSHVLLFRVRMDHIAYLDSLF